MKEIKLTNPMDTNEAIKHLKRFKKLHKEEAKEIANTDFNEDNLDLSPALEGWVIEGIDKD